MSLKINLTNLPDKIVEEISLEGLDGATINCLIARLKERLFIEQNPIDLDRKASNQLKTSLNEIFDKPSLLNLILNLLIKKATSDRSISFYLLSKPRLSPIIFNRFDTFDPTKTGEESEDAELDEELIGTGLGYAPDEIFDPDFVQNLPIQEIDGERGSNSDKKRKMLNFNELSLDFIKNIENFMNKIVVVSSLDHRLQALANNSANAYSAIKSLTDMEYILLEYIVRSRYQGCIQSYLNKKIFVKLNSHIDFLMKKLIKTNLITKQNYAYFTRSSSSGNRDRPVSQILILHKKFHRVVRNKQDSISNKILNFLKEQEDKKFNMQDLRDLTQLKSGFFKKNYEYMLKIGVIEINSLRADKKRPITLKQREVKFIKDLPSSILNDEDESCLQEDEYNNLSMSNYIREYNLKFIGVI